MYLLITLMVVGSLGIGIYCHETALGLQLCKQSQDLFRICNLFVGIVPEKKGMAAGSVIITVGFLRFPQEWDILLFIYITVNKRELKERMDFLLIQRPLHLEEGHH